MGDLVVFCSYSSRDFNLRDALELRVSRAAQASPDVEGGTPTPKIRMIADRFDMTLGAEFERWIEDSIIAADVVLPIITVASASSWWVAYELLLARRYGRKLIPVVEEGALVDARLPPWLKEFPCVFFPSKDVGAADRTDQVAITLEAKLRDLASRSSANSASKAALNGAHRHIRELHRLLADPAQFQHAFRLAHARSVLEAAVSEVKTLTGSDYIQDLSLGSAFVVRAEPIFQQASATFATSVDFVSTFWEKEASRLAPRYLAAQTNAVKRLFVFSTPREVTRHLNVLSAHHNQYGNKPGGCVLITSSERYTEFINTLDPGQADPELRKGDFAILVYGEGRHAQHYEARLTEDQLICRQLRDGPSRSQQQFIATMTRLANSLQPGAIDNQTGVMAWNDAFAGTGPDDRTAWKDRLVALFQRTPDNTENLRDRDVFHLVFFSRRAAMENTQNDDVAAKALRVAISEAVDELLKMRNPRDKTKSLIKELWFGDFNEGLKRMNIDDGLYGGRIKTGGLFVDNFPYCLMMRFDTRSDLEHYYKNVIHARARERIFRACDPLLRRLYDSAIEARDNRLKAAIYEAIEAAATRSIVRADFVEHEDIDWIVDREPRIAFQLPPA